MALFGKKDKGGIGPIITAETAVHKQTQQSNLNDVVIKFIREAVVIIGADGNVLLANPAAELMFGKTADEIVGLSYESSISILDKNGNHVTDQYNPIGHALLSGEYGETRDFDLVTLDSNKVTPVSIITTPTNGAGSDVVVTFRDITRELREEAERNDFISTASHEMRTPVASIEGYLGLAMNPATATVDERAMEYLTKAHEASRHLGKLFQDLLDTTKLDEGRASAHMEPVELVALVKQISDGQVPNIAQKGLGYQFGSGNIDSRLGSVRSIGQLIYASVDPDFLREVIDNLIENAIKYTPEGWITVNVKADNDNAIICVEDTGIGMAREDASHIFQKFYRIDNRDTREIGGTGLGLYLVKQRVEAMNGRIWVESEVGKGSKFFVSFPRIPEDVYKKQRFAIDNTRAQQAMSANMQ